MASPDQAPDFEQLARELAPDLELIRLVAEGSVAQVYLAREAGLKREVAVKVLRADLASDEIARKRFEREAQAAANIKHANVAAVYRIGRLQSGIPYIVMEYIQGRTLAEVIRARGRLSLEDSRRIIGSLASALNSAHHKGVVHRDVRPGNVMWEDGSDRIVLVDFGIAASLEEQRTGLRLTTMGRRLGDPWHMSPEQMRGAPVVPESDVFALGVLGYELLTGAPPWATPVDRSAVPPRLPHVPPHISELLQRCLSNEPNQRPRALDVFDAVMRESVNAPEAEPGTVGDFLQELRRRKVGRVAIAYAVVAFVGLQAVQLLVDAMPAGGDQLYRAIVAITVAGFPVALALSWLFDLSSTGVRWSGRSGERTLWLPVVGLLLSVVIAVAAWLLITR